MLYDCAIIGGGLSGLAAGVRLARYCPKVVLVERNRNLGGLNTVYRRGGREIESGLHAMTNFAGPNAPKSSPLLKLLRQLRLTRDDLQAREQNGSEIRFPGTTLRFDNDFAFFESEIARAFPKRIDGFRRLDRMIADYDALSLTDKPGGARAVLSEYLSDPLLIDMLLCPLMYYGSPEPDDMNFAHFVVLYRSVFKEGFCRPAGGIKGLLESLENRYLEEGGELKTGRNVVALRTIDDRVSEVVLDDGERFETKSVLSSIGSLETFALLDRAAPEAARLIPGSMGFMECAAALERPAAERGHRSTIVFFNNAERFRFRNPDGLADDRSGVVCCPDNFRFEAGDPRPEPTLRVTALADYDRWAALSPEAYRREKREIAEKFIASASKMIGRDDTLPTPRLLDAFTPLTIERYTGHRRGAIYGGPHKIRDGRTSLRNLFLCGTDQGFLGIVGAMLSGVSIANAGILTKTEGQRPPEG